MPTREPIPTITNVPMIACATPPPTSPGGTCRLMKNEGESEAAPLMTKEPRIRKSGSTATSTAATISPTMSRDLNRRKSRRSINRPAFVRPAR